MRKEKTTLTGLLFWTVIAGNIIFVLWITVNGIKEGFQGTMPEKASYVGLMGLLTINCLLLIQKRKQQTTAQS